MDVAGVALFFLISAVADRYDGAALDRLQFSAIETENEFQLNTPSALRDRDFATEPFSKNLSGVI
jgi:hypothetical protein